MGDIKLYKVTEPRIDFAEDSIYTIPESASDIIYRQYPVTTYSDNNITFQQALDRKYAVSSKMFMNVQFDVIITGTPAVGGRLVQQGTSGPRFLPLTSVTQTLEVSLNNQSFTQKVNWYHDALMRYNNTSSEIAADLSMCPSMFDYYQNYDDFLLYGSALNPLAGVGEAGPGIEPRGGFPYTVIAGNAINGNTATVRFRTYEPIIVSPLNWGHENSKSFRNLTTIGINYTFQTDLSRVWCRAPSAGGTITGITATISSQPIVELITMTPKIYQQIQTHQRYAYGEIQAFPQAIGTVAAGASSQTQLNNITLSGVPSRIYLYLRRRDADRTYETTDTYARIDNISMIFGNKDGIFTQCSPQQLYAISAQNGYLGSFSDWYKYSGSVFCMDFSKDVPIKDLEAAGLQENIQFQVTVNFSNINLSEAINFTMYAVVVYDGLVTIDSEAMVNKERNILTKLSIHDASVVQMLPYKAVDTYSVSGGSFGNKLRRVASSVQGAVKKGIGAYNALPPGVKSLIKDTATTGLDLISPRIMEVARDIGPVAKDVIASLAGKGYTENQIYNELARMRGMGYAGGKKLTKAQLKKMIAN